MPVALYTAKGVDVTVKANQDYFQLRATTPVHATCCFAANQQRRALSALLVIAFLFSTAHPLSVGIHSEQSPGSRAFALAVKSPDGSFDTLLLVNR